MIGPGTTIRGNISGQEDLTVEGRVEGSVRLEGDLTIAQGAELAADLEARRVEISGKVSGNVNAGESLTIDRNATVVGEVTASRLVIEEGARFKGRINMDVDIPGVDTSALDRRRR